MVDVWNLDSIHKITVFRWPTTSYYQVVSIANRRKGNSGEGAHDAGDIPISTRYLLDVLKSDDKKTHGTFRGPSQGRRADGHFAQHLRIFFQFHLDERGSGRDHILGSQLVLIADTRHHEPMNARLDIVDLEPSDGVGSSPRLDISFDVDIGIWNALTGLLVDYFSVDGKCLCGCYQTSMDKDSKEPKRFFHVCLDLVSLEDKLGVGIV